jgi:hypothetical protein
LSDATPLAAGALVAGGLVGSLVGPDWLILLAGLGMFGPFVLRESGMLSWRDEFQRETTLRAGMHSLLAVGVLVTATMATQGFGGINLPMDSIRASTVLLVTVVVILPLVRDLVGYLGSPTQGWTKPLNIVSVATVPLLVTGLALVTQRGVPGED